MRYVLIGAFVGVALGVAIIGALRLAYPDFTALPAAVMVPTSSIGGCGSDVGPRPSCAPGTTTGGAR